MRPTLHETGLTCPRCGDLAALDATCCAGCGTRLVLSAAERYPRPSGAALAHIRADLAARDRSRSAGRRHTR